MLRSVSEQAVDGKKAVDGMSDDAAQDSMRDPDPRPTDAVRQETIGRLAVLLGLVLVAIAGYATLLVLIE
jgi:hypothetical protein